VKGNVHSEKAAPGNKYNRNFRNQFCACEQEYDPHKERGTMFQCIGLGTVDEGCCGEDWYHPECIMGLPRDWNKYNRSIAKVEEVEGSLQTIKENEAGANGNPIHRDSVMEDTIPEVDDSDIPPGFPNEDDFEYFICYKCVEAFPWIKKYAGTKGFLMPVYHGSDSRSKADNMTLPGAEQLVDNSTDSRKRKATPDDDGSSSDQPAKRQRSVDLLSSSAMDTSSLPTHSSNGTQMCHYDALPVAPSGTFSLFMLEDFRPSLCRCPKHYPLLTPHVGLLEEEDTYEPPLSEGSSDGGGAGSIGSRSLLERGEAALSNVDRVRAIEGVMVYNHLRDKVKNFLKPFAESGTPVGAEDVKKYFESLRGDAEAIKAAGMRSGGGEEEGGDNRKEQSGKSSLTEPFAEFANRGFRLLIIASAAES
jgi:E3 ubiquitin-protein ligase UBR7